MVSLPAPLKRVDVGAALDRVRACPSDEVVLTVPSQQREVDRRVQLGAGIDGVVALTPVDGGGPSGLKRRLSENETDGLRPP